MSKALITEQYLTDIADSIRAKLGVQTKYLPSEMSAAIDSISGGGVTVEPLSVTANGTYTAPTGKAYTPVTVNVAGGGSANTSIASFGSSNAITHISDSVLKMSSYATDFIVPKDSNGNNVSPDLTQPFEIGCRFRLKNTVGNNPRNVFGSRDSCYHSPSINVLANNANIGFNFSSNGSAWDDNGTPIFGNGYAGVPIDTWITVKITFDGTDCVFYADDGTNQASQTKTATPYYSAGFAFSFGAQNKSQYSIAAIANTEIDLNHTYIKQNGSFIWGYDSEPSVPVLVPKSITQNGTYDPADDNADGYSSVTVNVSGGSSGIISIDSNLVYQLINVTKANNTFVFDGTTDSIKIGASANQKHIIIEVDVDSMSLTSGAHRRFIMGTTDKGLIYRSTGVWSFYSGSWQTGTFNGATDGDFFDNCTVKVEIDTDNKWHIYKDNVLVFEPSAAQAITDMYIGSPSGSIDNAVISGIRISEVI